MRGSRSRSPLACVALFADIQCLDTRRGAVYIVTRNNDRPLVFRAGAGR